MARKVRLDRLLVDRGLAGSRQRARELIESGAVLVAGVPATRVGAQVDLDLDVSLAREDFPWVSRGALKLLGVLDPFGVRIEGRVCADLGSSTGGFTHVLLERGAQRVYAIDVGRGLLHYKLRDDPRVVLMEGVNARHLTSLPEPVDLVVGDLSFISITLILPTVARIVRPGGEAVVLVKPQFEVGRRAVSSRGRVRSEDDRQAAIARVAEAVEQAGLDWVAGMDSPVAGARSGNVEHFLYLRRAALAPPQMPPPRA